MKNKCIDSAHRGQQCWVATDAKSRERSWQCVRTCVQRACGVVLKWLCGLNLSAVGRVGWVDWVRGGMGKEIISMQDGAQSLNATQRGCPRPRKEIYTPKVAGSVVWGTQNHRWQAWAILNNKMDSVLLAWLDMAKCLSLLIQVSIPTTHILCVSLSDTEVFTEKPKRRGRNTASHSLGDEKCPWHSWVRLLRYVFALSESGGPVYV